MQQLRCLLEQKWPHDKFCQTYIPDPNQPPGECVAWSRTGLIAFSAPVVEADAYCIYIQPAARGGEVARVATTHGACVRYLRWDSGGHYLLSVDDAGVACLWTMQDYSCNAWRCMFTHNYGRGGAVGVQMLAAGAGSMLVAGCLGWMVVTGNGEVHVTHQDAHTRQYHHATAPLVDLSLGSRLSCIAVYENGLVRVACVPGRQAGIVRVCDVQVTFTGTVAKVHSRSSDAVAAGEVRAMAFDPHLEALFTCTIDGSLQYWLPRPAAVPAPALFGKDHDPVRKTEWHSSIQAGCGRADIITIVPVAQDLAVVYQDGAIEWRSSATLEAVARHTGRPGPGVPASMAADVSCNEACVAVVDAHAGLRIIETPASLAEDPPCHYARAYEAAMARGNDCGDIMLGVVAHQSAGVCVGVAQQLEARARANKGAQPGLHTPRLLVQAALLYRKGGWLDNAEACGLRLRIAAMQATFRAKLLAPAPAEVVAQLDDEAGAEAVARRLQMDYRHMDSLLAACEWVVQSAVLVLKAIADTASHHDTISVSTAILPDFIHETGATGLGAVADTAGVDAIRELLVYAVHVRRRGEEGAPGMGLASKTSAVLGLYRAFTALHSSKDPIADNIDGPRLRGALKQVADWDTPFRVPAYEVRLLRERLDLLPRNELPDPGRTVVMVTSFESSDRRRPSAPHDIISNMTIKQGSEAIQCTSCGRLAVRGPLIGRWNTACICGGLWCNVDLRG